MTSRELSRFTLSLCMAAAVLTGCGGVSGTPVSPAPEIREHHQTAVVERVLHIFGGPGDGALPLARLLNVNGALYGTTSRSGAKDQDGTIFAISPNGQEQLIYTPAGNGNNMLAGLINVDGMLYGTAPYGGPYQSSGVVYSLQPDSSTPLDADTVVYAFPYGYSGLGPNSDLTYANGKLYGTTEFGGYSNAGTIFSLTTNGQRRVLHLFGNTGDGSTPGGDLVAINGKIYGTTRSGGTGCSSGCGTVYSVTQGGIETVLYKFTGGSDGYAPNGLINVGGTMYGTTWEGGGRCGCGTVFSVDTLGHEKVLYSFTGAPDGASPTAGLLYAGGTFYGTTTSGGANVCETQRFDAGCGTVFSITPSGSETVLYSFSGMNKSHPDGLYPATSLITVDGKLFGTTEFGGIDCLSDEPGCGTVFSIEPSPPLPH
jgi:uncharacterized repeat protein (TIGR03803 family)